MWFSEKTTLGQVNLKLTCLSGQVTFTRCQRRILIIFLVSFLWCEIYVNQQKLYLVTCKNNQFWSLRLNDLNVSIPLKALLKASASKFEQWTPHGSAISSHSLSRYSMLTPNPAFKVPLNAEPSVKIWWKSLYVVFVLWVILGDIFY